jgi:purine-binding chemotaxis protein CheW
MSAAGDRPDDRVTMLRDAFDGGFARARATDAVPRESLLAIRIGADPYALPMTDLAGLFAGKKITRLPGSVSALLGVAGFRGTVLPVYDLAVLLGYARTATPRWVVAVAAAPVALAFDAFDGYLTVPHDAIAPEAHLETHQRHVRDVIQTVDPVRPLISVASVLEWIRSRASRAGSDKEQ